MYIIIVHITKYNNLLGCSHIHILFINVFLNPFTKNVTGFKFKNLLRVTDFIVSGFHIIPDSQKTAVIKAFTHSC